RMSASKYAETAKTTMNSQLPTAMSSSGARSRLGSVAIMTLFYACGPYEVASQGPIRQAPASVPQTSIVDILEESGRPSPGVDRSPARRRLLDRRRHWRASSPTGLRRARPRLPLLHVDAPHEQPRGERQPAGRHQREQVGRGQGWGEDERERPRSKGQTSDHQQHAEPRGEEAGAEDQVAAQHGGDAVEENGQHAADPKELEAEQCHAFELSGRKRFRERPSPREARHGEEEHLRHGVDGGPHEPEERGEQSEIPAHGPQQLVEDQRQRDIADCLDQVPAKPKRNSVSSVRNRSSVTATSPGATIRDGM